MRGSSDAAAPRVLRAASSALAFWAAAGLAAFLLIDAAVRGAGTVVLHWGPLILLVVWVLWVLLYRTSVKVDAAGVTVHNFARVHVVPWEQVVAIIRGPQVTLEVTDGSRIVCAGSPFPRRPGVRRRDTPKKDAQDAFVEALDAARERGGAGTDAVRSFWDMPSLIVGGVLLVATVLTLALVR